MKNYNKKKLIRIWRCGAEAAISAPSNTFGSIGSGSATLITRILWKIDSLLESGQGFESSLSAENKNMSARKALAML